MELIEIIILLYFIVIYIYTSINDIWMFKMLTLNVKILNWYTAEDSELLGFRILSIVRYSRN
jgi:hypothetical protein